MIYEVEFAERGKNPTIRVADDGTLVQDLQKRRFRSAASWRTLSLTGGQKALTVLKVLEACQISLERGGGAVRLDELTDGVHK